MPRRRGFQAVLLGWIALFIALLVLVVESHRPVGAVSARAERSSGSARQIVRAAWGRGAGAGERSPMRRAGSVESSDEACVVSGVVIGSDGKSAVGVAIFSVPIGGAGAAGSRPRAGSAEARATDGDGESDTTTDAAGAFELELPPGDYSLAGYRSRGGDEEVTEVLDPLSLRPGERLAGLELHLAAGVAIEGRVIAEELPSEREVCARIHVGDAACVSRAVAGEDGRFVLTGVPLHALVLVAEQGGRQAIAHVTPPARNVELRFPSQPLVTGQVVDEEGEPRSGVTVAVLDGDRLLATEGSDDDGRFRLAIDHKGPIAVWAHGSESGASELLVRSSADARALRLVLHPGATLVGRVVLAATGEPVTDGEVALWRGAMRIDTAALDESGSYRFEHVPSGRLRVQLPSERFADAPAVEAVVGGGEARAPDLRVARGRVLRGRVTDATGRPVAGASIDLLPAGGGFSPVSSDDTGADGLFVLPGRFAGMVTLRASADGQVGDRVAVADRGADEQVVELRVQPEARVSGILRGPDGAPRAGVAIRCGGAERTSSPAGRFFISCPLATSALRVDDGTGGRDLPVTLRGDGDLFVELRL